MADVEKCGHSQDMPSSGSHTSERDSTTVGSYSPKLFSSIISSAVEPVPVQPKDGWRANLTVMGSFLAFFCTFGQMNAFGTFQSWYTAHQLQHMPPATISWIGSLQLFFFFFLGGFIGRLFDAYGPFFLMISGTALYLLSTICTSFSTRYYQFILSQGMLFGISIGLLFYPSIASISTHFSKYRATAVGIAAAGSSVGGVVYPIVLQYLFRKFGFPWAVRICGISSTFLCGVATLTVSSLPSQTKLGPILGTSIIKDTKFLFLSAGSCFVALGLFIPFFYIIDYTKYITGDPQVSFLVLAIMNAGGVLGRVLPAYLSDAIGRFNLLVPCAFLAGLSCLVLWTFAYSLPLVFVFATSYGFFSGAFISVINPCVAQISELHELGTRIGVLYSLISFPSLFGGPIAGAILVKDKDSYQYVAIFSGLNLRLFAKV
ncbi:Major facilitator superfamily domain containing protein [Amanita muscaria]